MNKKIKKIKIIEFPAEKSLIKVRSSNLILPKTPLKYLFAILKVTKLTVFTVFFVFLAMPSFAVFISAFESHVVNVTATIERQPIVINEFLPNPKGKDNAPKPKGEWVELYNLSSFPFDVAGWALYDNSDSRPLPITLDNSDNDGNVADSGETIVPSHGFLVVYLNGAYNGWLNNTGGDSVRLYDGLMSSGGILVDSYSYTSNAPENKSYARIPDGVGAFIDPIPTPLAPNKMDEPGATTPEDPVLDDSLQNDTPLNETTTDTKNTNSNPAPTPLFGLPALFPDSSTPALIMSPDASSPVPTATPVPSTGSSASIPPSPSPSADSLIPAPELTTTQAIASVPTPPPTPEPASASVSAPAPEFTPAPTPTPAP